MSDRLTALLNEGIAILHAAGIDTARVEAQHLLAHAHDVEVADIAKALIMCTGIIGKQGDPYELESAEVEYRSLLQQRALRIPLQHLTGTATFRFLTLDVGPGVFVPRPETEMVAQQGIDAIMRLDTAASSDVKSLAVDLCTGSGAIALALATETSAEVYAVELDDQAWQWAQRNITQHAPRVHLIHGDARTALAELNGRVDVVVSNPPYIPPDAVPVDPEVALHDPAIALYGLGPDGLEIPRGVIRAAARLLRPGGIFVMEHAQVQADSVRTLVGTQGYFNDIVTLPDLTGRDRMVRAVRNEQAWQE